MSQKEAFEYFDEIQAYDDLELLNECESRWLEEIDNKYY